VKWSMVSPPGPQEKPVERAGEGKRSCNTVIRKTKRLGLSVRGGTLPHGGGHEGRKVIRLPKERAAVSTEGTAPAG